MGMAALPTRESGEDGEQGDLVSTGGFNCLKNFWSLNILFQNSKLITVWHSLN